MMAEDLDTEVTIEHADEEIGSAWKDILAKQAPEDKAEIEKVAEAEKPAAESDTEKADRARDATGKFVKEQKAAEAAAPATGAVAATDPAAATDTTQRDLLRPPSSWTPTAKAQWAALPPEIRAEVQRREGDFLKGQSGLIQEAEFARTMKQTLEPYRAMVEADGGNLPTATANLFRTASILRNGSPQAKLQAIHAIARDFSIPLTQPEGEVPQQQQGPIHDPRVDTLLSQMQAEQRGRMQAEEQEIQSAISTFAAATDASGAPAHPYFENLENHIAALIPQFKKPGVPYDQVLKEAYDAAVWANPETRTLAQQQSAVELEAKRREESLRAAAEAKKAASNNVPRRGARPAQPALGSMEDTIRRTGRELGLF